MLHARTDMYMYMYMKAKTFTGTCKLNMDSEEWAKHVIEMHDFIVLF